MHPLINIFTEIQLGPTTGGSLTGWNYDTVAGISFNKKESYDGTKKARSEIKNYNPLWLQVTLEMWPVNAEPHLDTRNPEWGKELRERWKNEGKLWLDYLKSEPINLNLNQ